MPVLTGNKNDVWEDRANRTSGGLKKEDLMKNKWGRIVSKKKHEQGLKAIREGNLKPCQGRKGPAYPPRGNQPFIPEEPQ